jgi:hypothetical protein
VRQPGRPEQPAGGLVVAEFRSAGEVVADRRPGRQVERRGAPAADGQAGRPVQRRQRIGAGDVGLGGGQGERRRVGAAGQDRVAVPVDERQPAQQRARFAAQ